MRLSATGKRIGRPPLPPHVAPAERKRQALIRIRDSYPFIDVLEELGELYKVLDGPQMECLEKLFRTIKSNG